MKRLAVIAVLPAFLLFAGSSSAQAKEIIQTTPWSCTSAVDLDLVKVTLPQVGRRRGVARHRLLGPHRAARSGRRHGGRSQGAERLPQRGSRSRHRERVHPLLRSCPGGAHQDGIQAMGGRGSPSNVVFDIVAAAAGNMFINRAGSNATTPTRIVFRNGKVGLPSSAGGPATPVNINVQIDSSIRDSIVCRSPRFNNAINTHGNASASVNNTILPVGDPGCAPDVTHRRHHLRRPSLHHRRLHPSRHLHRPHHPRSRHPLPLRATRPV